MWAEITETEFNEIIAHTYENEEAGMIESVQEINKGQYFFIGILVAKKEGEKYFKC